MAKAQVAAKTAVAGPGQGDAQSHLHPGAGGRLVVLRNVDVGQTVAASLQSPLLFSIAQDLRAMQVDTSVDEADVGAVKEGQRVTFTVDAYPGTDLRRPGRPGPQVSPGRAERRDL